MPIGRVLLLVWVKNQKLLVWRYTLFVWTFESIKLSQFSKKFLNLLRKWPTFVKSFYQKLGFLVQTNCPNFHTFCLKSGSTSQVSAALPYSTEPNWATPGTHYLLCFMNVNALVYRGVKFPLSADFFSFFFFFFLILSRPLGLWLLLSAHILHFTQILCCFSLFFLYISFHTPVWSKMDV